MTIGGRIRVIQKGVSSGVRVSYRKSSRLAHQLTKTLSLHRTNMNASKWLDENEYRCKHKWPQMTIMTPAQRVKLQMQYSHLQFTALSWWMHTNTKKDTNTSTPKSNCYRFLPHCLSFENHSWRGSFVNVATSTNYQLFRPSGGQHKFARKIP